MEIFNRIIYYVYIIIILIYDNRRFLINILLFVTSECHLFGGKVAMSVFPNMHIWGDNSWGYCMRILVREKIRGYIYLYTINDHRIIQFHRTYIIYDIRYVHLMNIISTSSYRVLFDITLIRSQWKCYVCSLVCR